MALFDFEKTTIKLPFAVTLITASLFIGGGVWRFESKMNDFESKLDALETKILDKTTIEFMKINNRIDLVEAKKFVMRWNFKRHKKAFDSKVFYCGKKTNNGKDNKEKYPQVCMVIPRPLESRKLKLPNIKKLKSLV